MTWSKPPKVHLSQSGCFRPNKVTSNPAEVTCKKCLRWLRGGNVVRRPKA